MNNQMIDKRLKELRQEEILIRSKLDFKSLSYNKNEWFASDKNVELTDKEILVNENLKQCYISYLESNNSFNLSPKHILINHLNLYENLNISFQGEVSGQCQIQLFIITYVNGIKQDVYFVELNSSKSINIENVDDIRLALRIQGNGKFKLKSIVLKPSIHSLSEEVNYGKSTKRNVAAKDIKVAMVVDEFTYESFRHECNAIYLSPDNWRQTLEQNKPDLFFCESAWAGKDPDKREWRGKIYSSVNFNKENRTELLSIIKYCKENGIPTIFWNKEDPSHYYDKVHNFVDTAVKFDYIFTTAEECVDLYKKEYNHDKVYPLMFAVQPKQFNPIETYQRTDDIIFSGSYYRQHPERCKIMDKIFDMIVERGQSGLVIYDRQYFNPDDNHKFPERFKPYIKPRLPYTKLDKGYKGSKFALNINTETKSRTMFARRVFELMASNTLVISNYSKGLDYQFGDLIFLLDLDNNDRLQEIINNAFKGEYQKHRLKALRHVLGNHTYENRFAYILDIVGVQAEINDPSVTAIVFVHEEADIREAIDLFDSQNYQRKKLFIVNINGNPLNTSQWLSDFGSEAIFVTDLNMLENYNNGLEDLIDSEYVTFINPSYYYGNNYLKDMMFSYKYLEYETKTIVVKNKKHVPYQFIKEGSMYSAIFPKKALEYYDYNERNEEEMVRKLFEVGYRVFNCDPFNLLHPKEVTEKSKVAINI